MVEMSIFENQDSVNQLTIENVKEGDLSTELIQELKAFMKEGGYGCLAGPQLGINKRFFLMEGELYINPYTENISEKGVEVFEVCENFPDKRIQSKRYQTIEISYEVNGKHETKKFKEDLSQYAQFCMDWLDHSVGTVVKTIKQDTVRNEKEISRNEPCPCGSGKKYKKCCAKVS